MRVKAEYLSTVWWCLCCVALQHYVNGYTSGGRRSWRVYKSRFDPSLKQDADNDDYDDDDDDDGGGGVGGGDNSDKDELGRMISEIRQINVQEISCGTD